MRKCIVQKNFIIKAEENKWTEDAVLKVKSTKRITGTMRDELLNITT